MKKTISNCKLKQLLVLLLCLSVMLCGCTVCQHEYEDAGEKVEATCISDGYTLLVCKKCGIMVKGKNLPAEGHIFEIETDRVEATCVSDGHTLLVCKKCGTVKGKILPAKGHTFGTEADIVEPSCTDDGYTLKQCVECGAFVSTDIVSAKGHTYSQDWSFDGEYHWHNCVYNDGMSDKTSHKVNAMGVCKQCSAKIDTGKRLLIIERFAGDSEKLSALLSNDTDVIENLNNYDYNFFVKTILIGTEEYNYWMNSLGYFDEIIFNNVANSDLPDGDIERIEKFVSVYGGGLLTIGGNDPTGDVHAYDREDLGAESAKTYRDMLPISAENYTSPMGIAFIIDTSGSMSGDPLYKAKAGLELAVRYGLSERDYVSIFTLDTIYGQVLPLTLVSNMDTIVNAIQSIGGTGGTVATNAITRAAQSLNANNNIARKHIIMLTDGIFGDKCEESEDTPYVKEARLHYTNSGITLSVVGIGMDVGSTYYNSCKQMTDAAGGKTYAGINLDNLGNILKDDIQQDEITAVTEGAFRPVAALATDPLFKDISFCGGADEFLNIMDFAIGAFYGGKIKQNAILALTDKYNIPVYAYWTYGNGKVGSFMCDLKGIDNSYSASSYNIVERKKDKSGQYKDANTVYSGIFESANGQKLIFNMILNLMV